MLTPPLLSDALASPAYTAQWATPALRALFHVDAAMHELKGGGAHADLKMSREALLEALTPDERRAYSERAPIATVRAAHAESLHALALRPIELLGMFGIDASTLRRWEKRGLIEAWRMQLGRAGQERRFRAADVVAFCARWGIPTPPALLPGATAADLPPEAFRSNKGTYAARNGPIKRAAARKKRREEDEELMRL